MYRFEPEANVSTTTKKFKVGLFYNAWSLQGVTVWF